MQIRFKIRNVDRVKKYLASVPRGAVRIALIAISEWLVGDSQSGLRHPEPYKFVTRKSAYGFSFFTIKQRRWFFWSLNTGQIDPGKNNRTGKSTEAWTYSPLTKGKNYAYKLVNDTPGGYWTRNDKRQARQPAKVGWKKVSAVVKANMTGALKAARIAVNKYLQSKR